MLDTVRNVLSRSTRTTFVECRDCGTAAPDSDGPCPACGSTEVATYEL